MKRNKLTWWFIDNETLKIQESVDGKSLMVYQKEFDSLEETLQFIEKLDNQLSRNYCKLIYQIEEL